MTEIELQPFSAEQIESLTFLRPNIRNSLQYHRGLDAMTLASAPAAHYIYFECNASSFHIGHLPGLRLCLALHDAVCTTNQIELMITDETSDVLKQLASLGFTSENTNFHINSKEIATHEYEIIMRMLSLTSISTLSHIFGENPNLGEYFHQLVRILPVLSKTRHCIVVATVEQDPFLRLVRDLARRMGFNLPTILYTKSVPLQSIYLNDPLEIIAEKVASAVVDVPYKLLEFFDDSDTLHLITSAYTAGLTIEDEIIRLYEIVPEKCIELHDGKHMLTSVGICKYLTHVICNILHKPKEGKTFVSPIGDKEYIICGSDLTKMPPADTLDLTISSRKLYSLPDDCFSSLSTLRFLNIANIGLSKIHKNTFAGLTSLRFLIISRNNIVKMPDGCFDCLENIEVIDIRNNPLQFPIKFTYLPKLQRFYINMNKTKYLPECIISGKCQIINELGVIIT